MNADMLQGRFARMGARAKVGVLSGGRRQRPLTLDIKSDDDGEFFDVQLNPQQRADLDVVDLRRRDRHLLLKAETETGQHYYLCGHDEMHWFVAGIPEAAGGLKSVFAAMEALKPAEVIAAQRRQGVKGKDRYRRKNAAYVRQGEWFFLPMPDLHVKREETLYNEPLSRGNGSKPHWAEFLCRRGGQEVYVCSEYPRGLSSTAYWQLLRDKPRTKSWNWRRMFRDPEAYVKGSIRHVDHKTIGLHIWHKVLMNTENQSQAMRHVVFLD